MYKYYVHYKRECKLSFKSNLLKTRACYYNMTLIENLLERSIWKLSLVDKYLEYVASNIGGWLVDFEFNTAAGGGASEMRGIHGVGLTTG